jgi:hypothetical protein
VLVAPSRPPWHLSEELLLGRVPGHLHRAKGVVPHHMSRLERATHCTTRASREARAMHLDQSTACKRGTLPAAPDRRKLLHRRRPGQHLRPPRCMTHARRGSQTRPIASRRCDHLPVAPLHAGGGAPPPPSRAVWLARQQLLRRETHRRAAARQLPDRRCAAGRPLHAERLRRRSKRSRKNGGIPARVGGERPRPVSHEETGWLLACHTWMHGVTRGNGRKGHEKNRHEKNRHEKNRHSEK